MTSPVHSHRRSQREAQKAVNDLLYIVMERAYDGIAVNGSVYVEVSEKEMREMADALATLNATDPWEG